MGSNTIFYKIFYHHLIIKEDVPELNNDILKRIKTAIETRLLTAPEKHGLPLRKTLKGYWKLRVGDYRIVYWIVKGEIHVLAMCHRSKVYKIALSRIH